MKIRILLADKNQIFLEGLVNVLERETNIEVVGVCRSGLEAVKSADEHQPDVILIDTELPECSGIEAMQRIHKRLSKVSIIVLTNSEVDADLISAVRAGARAYISKDVSVGNLIKVISLVAEGEVIVSPPMAARILGEFTLLENYKDAAKLEYCDLLSEREQVVLSFVAQGFFNKQIATTLFISENTVKVHLRNIMEKLHAHNRQQAVVLARVKDWLPEVTKTTTKQV